MTRQDFLSNYWHYYMLLEKRFLHTLNYVELDDNNKATYSDEYANLLLSTCSELDSFFKVYCGFNPDDRKTIADYASYVLADYPDITIQGIEICITRQSLKPFDGWDITKPGESLGWWTAYNHIKHSRVANKKEASQLNTLSALAALYLVEMKYLKKITDAGKEIDIPDNESSLFTPTGWDFHYASADSLVFPRSGNDVILGG